MAQNPLASLRAALAASRENLPLWKVLRGAYLERDEPETAVTLLAARTPADLPGAEERLLAARACLAAGHPARALDFAAGDAAEAKMLLARCLLALERN